MATENSLIRVIQLHEDERVDIEHFDLIGTLSTEAIRRLQRFIGERRFTSTGGTTDISGVEGCVISSGDAAFSYDTPSAGKMRLSASSSTPLEMLIANSLGIDESTPCGDIAQLGTTAAADFNMPTAGHPRMVLVRLDLLAADAASTTQRRYWDTSVSPPAEANRSDWASIKQHVLVWADADTSLPDADPNSVMSLMLRGYQPVAYLVYDSPITVSWQRLLPTVTEPTQIPGGQLTSVAQTLAAFAEQLEAVIGTSWDAVPATNLLTAKLKNDLQDVTLGLHGTRLTNLEGRATALEAIDAGTRLDNLEAQEICAGYIKYRVGPAPLYTGYNNVVNVSSGGSAGLFAVTLANGLSTFGADGCFFSASFNYHSGTAPSTEGVFLANIVWADDTHFMIHVTDIFAALSDLPTNVGLYFRIQAFKRA